jgi:hypothetical protein
MGENDTHILTLILDRLSHIEDRMNEGERTASDSRRRLHEKLENHSALLLNIDHRVTAVEKAVDSAAPTLREYSEIKAKVSGAGLLGLKLWKLGGWILGGVAAVYALRHDLATWWHWLMTR